MDEAKEALGGDDADAGAGQQRAEQVEGLAVAGDAGTPPEDLGQTLPEGVAEPRSPGESPVDALRSPAAEGSS